MYGGSLVDAEVAGLDGVDLEVKEHALAVEGQYEAGAGEGTLAHQEQAVQVPMLLQACQHNVPSIYVSTNRL